MKRFHLEPLFLCLLKNNWVCAIIVFMEENMVFTDTLERSLFFNLQKFGLDFSSGCSLAVAVSGGADSIALLTALSNILPSNFLLKAITVNHNIRPAEQTEGDAEYVQDYCRRLGIECARVDLPRGEVEKVARSFDCGIEDAARRLRYKAFEEFKERCQVDYICLAHNRNDQIETVLMRFLSGGDSVSLSGIPSRRGIFLRPMIEVSRKEIEAYLDARNIPYRTDCTNMDTSLLRNRVRHKLMPALDLNFPGWQNAVYNLAAKARDDAEVIENIAGSSLDKIGLMESEPGCCSVLMEEFLSLPKAVRRRVVYNVIGRVGPDSRVPYSFVEKICDLTMDVPGNWSCNAAGLRTVVDGGRICIQKDVKQATERCFSVTIKGTGTFVAGRWTIVVESVEGKTVLDFFRNGEKKSVISIPNLCFPFIIRNRQIDDEILTASGSFRSVSKVLEDWKCKGPDRDEVPVVQELASVEQRLVAVLGSVMGFRDWIVKG